MSARGARSRKVQQKDIDKKDKKTGKSKAVDTIHESDDAFAHWRTTPSAVGTRNGISRSITVSSNNSRATSRSSGTNDGNGRPRPHALQSSDSLDYHVPYPPQSSGGGSTSISDVSSRGKDKTKFQANGKETRAPRGRGGGVPMKKSATATPSPMFRSESSASYPSVDQKTWVNFKIWERRKDGLRPYSGFEFDDDMQSGSVLIYFKEEQLDEQCPLPSIRAELDILHNSGSTWLQNVLSFGRIDDDDNDWTLPTASESLILQQPYSRSSSQAGAQRMLGPTSPGGRAVPPFDIDQHYDGNSSRAPSRLDRISEWNIPSHSRSPPPQQRNKQSNPTHEIWFTAPEHIKTAQGQRLHHVAIRNFLALLHGKPIVGSDLFDMLNTLHPEIAMRYDMDGQHMSAPTPRERSLQMIINYLGQQGIDDVRTSIKSAMCILAWSEQDNVKWRQGYLETFVHLTGVMIPELEEVPEFKRLSVITRRNLGIAAKMLKLRVMEAEEKLSTFDFGDLWDDPSRVAPSPVYQSYLAFRHFLVKHYTRNYGNWPPATGKTWLNRKIILALQEDFGSLYDYLVNRDVVWSAREERASRKWEMVHRKSEGFKADVPELGITDLLVRYDSKYSYAHIPHPYPLLPRDIPKAAKEKEKKGLFSSRKKDKVKDDAKDAKAHLQLSILFSDATNIEKLDANFNGSTLIDKFEQFEMTTDLKSTTPREARLGRWVLLYGILQLLSTLSVDVQGLKYTDGTRYFLCTDLKRCPEWVTNGQIEHLEASQQRSWCWQRSWDLAPAQARPIELEASPSNQRTTAHEYNMEIIGHAVPYARETEIPSPPTDGTALVQNDIRRINEKINNLSLSHNAAQMFHQDFERRRENEKVMQSDFHDRKPRFDSLSPAPQPASVPHARHPDETYRLRASGLSDAQTLVPPPRSNMRQTAGSMNTDLAGYPFSPEEMHWPVPPGYREATQRESGIGYNTGSWSGHPEVGDGMGNSFLDISSRNGDLDRRSPRRMHENNGWV